MFALFIVALFIVIFSIVWTVICLFLDWLES